MIEGGFISWMNAVVKGLKNPTDKVFSDWAVNEVKNASKTTREYLVGMARGSMLIDIVKKCNIDMNDQNIHADYDTRKQLERIQNQDNIE